MKSKWSVDIVTRKEKPIAENDMKERLADVWELLHALSQSPPAPLLPKAKISPEVMKDSENRSAS